MLYAAWKETVRSRPNELALTDLGSSQRWTFRELDQATDALTADHPIFFPRGASVDFILQVLLAWQLGRPVCPLEEHGQHPTVTSFPASCAHLKTTSGSTGAPRFIVFTGPQLAADADNIVAAMGLRPDWPNLGLISLAHSYGFSNLVLPLLLHGIPLILAPSRLPETVRQAATQFTALTLPAVPALWRVWHDANAISPAIKLAISAGAALPSALEREIFERSGLKVHNFYGASECGGICYDASSTPRASDDDVGSPMPGVQLDFDSESRLIVTSDSVGQTYWPSPSDNLGGGRFRAGDRAELRHDRVFLLGRHTDTINIAGQKVAPETIEHMILRHPGVRECVVFGVPDRNNVRAELIVAFVAGESTLDSSSLKRFATEHLPSWQAPRHWWIVPVLSDSARGKISRTQWRERFLAGEISR